MVRLAESQFYPIFKSDIDSLRLGPDPEEVWKRLSEKFEAPGQLQRALTKLWVIGAHQMDPGGIG